MMVASSAPLTNDWPCSGIGEQHVAPGVRGGETQRLGECYQVVGCRETGWLGPLQGEEPRTWGSWTHGQQLSCLPQAADGIASPSGNAAICR
jgi:hypothetical protein